MARFELDKTLIREMADLLEETGLSEIEIEISGRRVRVARGGGATVVATAPAPASTPPGAAPGNDDIGSEAADAAHPGAVPSPMVGTIYMQPEPGAPAFVKVGDDVEEGQTLLIIEAMKTMNPVIAPRAGKVTKIPVANGQPVEFGDVLMILE
ncbi:MAG: acetyl-CoA carboxylase biotin carboxyl carrier protein subunit [Alphaproteobacteria bacterium]